MIFVYSMILYVYMQIFWCHMTVKDSGPLVWVAKGSETLNTSEDATGKTKLMLPKLIVFHFKMSYVLHEHTGRL